MHYPTTYLLKVRVKDEQEEANVVFRLEKKAKTKN